jgi:hypothetical protein
MPCLDIETLLKLLDETPPNPIYRYLLCHPHVESNLRMLQRQVETLAGTPPISQYGGLEIVSHPKMLLSQCLALETREGLERVLKFLNTITESREEVELKRTTKGPGATGGASGPSGPQGPAVA